MQLILGILGFIFIFGLAVLAHELGHFLTARKFGVLCNEFAIGLGPVIWKKRKGETLYTLRAIPMGGFVSMGTDEGERDVFNIKEGSEIGLTLNNEGHVVNIHFHPDEGQISGTLLMNTFDISTTLQVALERAGVREVYPVDPEAWYMDAKAGNEARIVPTNRRLEAKPKRQRFVIMAAGAVMNFILAYVLVLLVGLFTGEVIGAVTELSTVNPSGPAYVAGLQAGDVLIEINGSTITEGGHVSEALGNAGNQEVLVVFERAGQRHEVFVTPVPREGHYIMDVHLQTMPIVGERSLLGVFRTANARWVEGAMMIVNSLQMIASGEAGAGDLAGVVGIVHMTSEVAMLGFVPLLMFASVININLGIFNLLPFPALDGGHITFIAIEAIIGKPVNAKIQHTVSLVGFVLLMALMLFTVFNDVLRLVN